MHCTSVLVLRSAGGHETATIKKYNWLKRKGEPGVV
jgi:hypothetical protein